MGDGGQHHYYGDHVTMHGSGNTGIDKRGTQVQSPAPELQQALHELRALVGELRGEVPRSESDTLDDALPALRPGADVPQPVLRRALDAVARTASAANTLGPPVVEAVNRVLGLLGGH
ncbi:hypothetical protein [Streptomyces sp. NPDC058045]|uniref:hypothetical protein n=1 Tax=Streptomyces sp. NPDC058045 TaxID=3346311 RepID=UPI0036EED032